MGSGMISSNELKQKARDFFNNVFISNYPIVTAGIISAILLIFIIFSIYTQSKDNIIHEFQKHQLTSVESAARGIEGVIENIIKDLGMLKHLISVQNQEVPALRASFENLHSFYQKEDKFLTTLLYYDNQGSLQIVIPPSESSEDHYTTEGNLNKPSSLFNTKDELTISRLLLDQQNEGRIRVSAPVFHTQGTPLGKGEFFGTLAADIDIKGMTNYFMGHINLNGSYVSILDADGTILDHPCPQFAGKNIKDIDIKIIDENNKAFPFFEKSHNLLDSLFNRKEGTLRIISPNLEKDSQQGRLELLAYSPIRLPGRNWIVIMFTPYDEVLRPIGELQKRFTLIMLGLIILMTVGNFLFVTANKKRICTETRVKLLTREIQLEEKIKKSEAKLRAVLHSIQDAITILDQELTVIWSNAKDEGKEVIGKKCYEAHRGLGGYCLHCVVKESFADGQPHFLEVVGQDEHQKVFYQMSSSPIVDGEGNVVNVVEMIRDMSNLRRMDMMVRESEERYRHLVEQMNEGLVVIDSENKIIFVNKKFCDLLGRSHQELISQQVGSFLKAENITKVEAAIDQGKGGHASSIEFEVDTVVGDHLTLIGSFSALFNEKSEYRGVSVVFTEITERRKLEKELRISRDKFGAILKSLSDGVMIIDHDRIIQYMNESAKKIFDDQIHKVCYQALWNRSEPCEICLAEEIFERKQNFYMTKDSVEGRILDISGSPIVMEDGAISLLKVFRDITERKYLESRLIESEQNRLRDLKERYRFGNIIGKNHKMQEIYDLISVVSQNVTTVLIQGASGTGKELIARAIHYNSPQHEQPFIGVSCSALPDGLLESELFGHVRGAFTGAIRDKMGRFESADGGTLFLDEIGDISPLIQVKLLRVLQERQFERVGSLKTVSVNVRVIAATNKDLKAAVAKGEFREDLYYRLNVVNIQLPSMKERSDDIPFLVNHFIEKFNKKFNKGILSVSSTAMDCLISYDWPGNIRQLENVIEHAFICAKGKRILPEDLTQEIQIAKRKKKETATILLPELEMVEGKEKAVTLDKMEALMILNALRQTNNHLGNAAQTLGIARSTLWRLMKKHNITKETIKESTQSKKIVSFEDKVSNRRGG